ncbi:hypothetical protein ABZX98_07400 [Streptomyces sp. NPDC002992]|uniref:hypothetical protein n=1 Tax=Streptomyces sp. NPDC002992 TaxID=3154273 RepID=UPI0033AA3F31
MTDRRTFGTGPQVPDRIRPAQADLLGVCLPDFEELLGRGVLAGARRPATPGARCATGPDWSP